MEVWTTVLVALIVALSTLGATIISNKYSTKRFAKELERAREVDYRQRRREVRGEPLLKLRTELAIMASKQDKLLATASQNLITSKTKEEVKKELQGDIDDFNAYLASGDFTQTLFMQCATDIVDKAEEIRKDYKASLYAYLFHEYVDAEEMKQAMGVSERNRTKIIEVQELINKRLEEL